MSAKTRINRADTVKLEGRLKRTKNADDRSDGRNKGRQEEQ
jgi:hypothetical protein